MDSRAVFCNRTLNLHSIRAIGYDMDYTLVHYNVREWEGRAYRHLQTKLLDHGWPVGDLEFDPLAVIRGLILDTKLGNIVKANRFGYIVRAFHGTRLVPFEDQRALYGRTLVDLAEDRWRFLNTLFSLSEGCAYAQLVELFDRGKRPDGDGPATYAELYACLQEVLDETHLEGELKREITADPGRFVAADPEIPLALLDQVEAGKRLLLITNSEWPYTRDLMAFAFDPHLPAGMSWEDLFELIIVGARKPSFFSARLPLFAIVDEDGHLLPAELGFPGPGRYQGGDAGQVEAYLGLSGNEILFVGDHIYADVKVSKSVLRWRTALILRELEEEIRVVSEFERDERRLVLLMREKEKLERSLVGLQLALQREEMGHAPSRQGPEGANSQGLETLRREIEAIDQRIGPLARKASTLGNPRWGPMLRAGNDKSHLARQLENSADIYTSRVANFLAVTPFAYLRSSRGSLPHDPVIVP